MTDTVEAFEKLIEKKPLFALAKAVWQELTDELGMFVRFVRTLCTRNC